MSPLSDLSSSPPSSRPASPSPSSSSSELSDLDSDVDMEDDFEQYSRPTPGKSELRALVKGLTDYAEMLQWRIGRVAPEDAPSNTKTKEKEKEKAKEIPATRFYS